MCVIKKLKCFIITFYDVMILTTIRL